MWPFGTIPLAMYPPVNIEPDSVTVISLEKGGSKEDPSGGGGGGGGAVWGSVSLVSVCLLAHVFIHPLSLSIPPSLSLHPSLSLLTPLPPPLFLSYTLYPPPHTTPTSFFFFHRLPRLTPPCLSTQQLIFLLG